MSMKAVKAGICGIMVSVAGCSADIVATQPGAVASKPYVYNLGPGDRIRINVYNEPGLSNEYVVDSEGRVSFPLIGLTPVQGMTTGQLSALIAGKLDAQYFQKTNVAVDLVESRPVYVLGEVNKAGQYPYRPGMTVLAAVATAGGFTYRANQKQVMVHHPDSVAEERLPLTADMLVYPGDTIRIRERNF